MNILFINCCARGKESRTLALAKAFLDEYTKINDASVCELDLSKTALSPLDADKLALRTELSEKGDFSHDMFKSAHEFANAERIVIAAPYWDLSFPAQLKTYIENICVTGIAFCYTETGAKGLCRADKLMYITTCGAFLGEMNFGGDYIKGLCTLWGIPEFSQISAEGLDIDTFDANEIMAKATASAKSAAKEW